MVPYTSAETRIWFGRLHCCLSVPIPPLRWGKGIMAWDDDGSGFVMQVTTPDWPGYLKSLCQISFHVGRCSVPQRNSRSPLAFWTLRILFFPSKMLSNWVRFDRQKREPSIAGGGNKPVGFQAPEAWSIHAKSREIPWDAARTSWDWFNRCRMVQGSKGLADLCL